MLAAKILGKGTMISSLVYRVECVCITVIAIGVPLGRPMQADDACRL